MELTKIVTSLFLITYISVQVIAVRVCPSYTDYFLLSSKCYDNNDTELNATSIIKKWGFQAEEFNIYTDDGYQLLVIRAYKSINNKTPLVFAHGFLGNAKTHLVLGNKSVVYQLLNSDRQVFLINHRGTTYSMGHKSYSSSEISPYWDFSFHEMAVYDVPKILDLVIQITGQKPIWIGYSMGSTTSITYTTLFPDEAKTKLVGIITLGTGCFFGSVKSLLVRFFAPLNTVLTPLGKLLWKGQFLPRKQLLPLYKLVAISPITYWAGYLFFSLIVGHNWKGISAEHFPVVAINTGDTVGLNVARHYAQLVYSGEFVQFDHGTTKNMQLYGSSEPPKYDLSKVSVPIAQFLGKGDYLTTVEAGERVNNLINSNLRFGITIIGDKHWTTLNYIDHKRQQELLGVPLQDKISEMEKQVSNITVS